MDYVLCVLGGVGVVLTHLFVYLKGYNSGAAEVMHAVTSQVQKVKKETK